MTKYHISPDDVARICNPKSTGKCKYGNVEHFESIDEANKKIEEKNLSLLFSGNFKKPKNIPFQGKGELRTLSKNFQNNGGEKENEEMSEEQKRALRSYSSYASCIVNPLLVNHKKYEYVSDSPDWQETNIAYDFNSEEELKSFMNTLDESLKERSDEERIVYRGTPIYSELHEKIEEEFGEKIEVTDTEKLKKALQQYYKMGKVLQFDNYLSATADPEIAAQRTEDMDGSKITYYDRPEIQGIVWEMKTSLGKDLTQISTRGQEKEITLPRETYFRISNVEIAPESYKTMRIRRNGEQKDMDRNNIAIVIQLEEVDENGNRIMNTNEHIPQRTIEECLEQAK